MFRDKVRCPICKKEMKLYFDDEDARQVFLLSTENDTREKPLKVCAYACHMCGNIQLFGAI